jgi:hypothetical protein
MGAALGGAAVRLAASLTSGPLANFYYYDVRGD